MLLQEYDGELPSLALRTSPVGKYLALRTRETREHGFVRIRHACLANIARLKACKFLNPIPPLAFELHIHFRLIQHILDSCCFWPYQKFFIILSKSSHKLWGSWKQLMVYAGNAWAIALMRISLPPIESSLPFQPTSFCPTLSFKVSNTYFLDLPINDGRPKYLECFEPCMGPRMAKIFSLTDWGIFGLKNIEDFSMLIFWPNASSYVWRICFNFWLSLAFALLKRMLSSAKKRWVILGQPLQIEMLIHCWFRAASFMTAERPSTQRRKRLREKGSPWQSPLVGVIFPHTTPFIITEYETVVMHSITQFIHLVLKPILSITLWMKNHSTLSKALLMSSLVAMKPSLPAFLWFKKCINSKATSTLLVMSRSEMKAL